MSAEKCDEVHARELAERLREDRRPRCPQLRVQHIERLYPVQGCCVLSHPPGWFMIPTVEEYREYCTTPRFGDCCWFSGSREKPEPILVRRGEQPTGMDAPA